MFLFKPTNFLSFALLSKQLCSVFNGHNVFIKVGVFNAEGPPVPIPNTEVKLCSGENTCLATDRKDSSMPTQKRRIFGCDAVSDFNAEGPPVPIPNTEVKLCSGENTCLATDRKDSSLLTQSLPFGTAKGLWFFRNPLKNFTRKSVIYNVFQVARLSKEEYLIFLLSSSRHRLR